MRLRFRTASIALAAWPALAGQAPLPAPASTPAARSALMGALGQVMQGDMRGALAALRTVPQGDFAGSGAALRSCLLDRFGAHPGAAVPTPPLPPTATRALALYRAYWRAALLDPGRRAADEEALRRSLAALLGLAPATEMDAVETRLQARLEAEGVHALLGRTPPFRELMLWRTQSDEMREIALPEGVHRTRVVLLDDFASLGWAGYATCDRSITGGWVRPDGIYAVRPGWGDLNGEEFLVSFLSHEAQHFADKERYGELASWELEYRAKLAELAMADRTLAQLLEAFAGNQGDDPDIPHSYANKRVLAALRTRLGLAPEAGFDRAPDAIRAAALAELRADSARRRPRTG